MSGSAFRQPPIEDYAYLSDCRSGALVSSAGSVDWLCFPRFDSPACFARLVGGDDSGHWSLGPAANGDRVRTNRWYLEDSLVLCTEHNTESGTVRVFDALTVSDDDAEPHRLVRIVEGRSGEVPMRSELRIRFDYGSIVPWVRRIDGGILAVGGPDAMTLTSDVDMHPDDMSTVAEFTVGAGDRVGFLMTWYRAADEPPPAGSAADLLEAATRWWQDWAARISYTGAYADDVRSSLVTLKGLSHRPSGGFVAAPTTSLPEWIGGTRNWDYRYCWLRDAAFTLGAMLTSGCTEEATAWRDWLLRAIAGDPGRVQIMYGLTGERRLPEIELDWLSGYAGSRPVRTGNGAWDQLQIDVYGEVAETLHLAREAGMEPDENAWQLQLAMLDWLEGNWNRPDDGIWEARGEPARHTYSQVMAWVAFDRAARTIDQGGLPGDADRWRRTAAEIHETVCANGVNADGVFIQTYGSDVLDASALLVPVVGFLPPSDRRVTATVEAIQRELTTDGLVHRYATDRSDDGVGGEEGTFLLCSFWMVDALALSGRRDQARQLYEHLLDLRNDVGLLAEEYDPGARRQLGNFPQAFSHIGIVGSAATLCDVTIGPAERAVRHEAD